MTDLATLIEHNANELIRDRKLRLIPLSGQDVADLHRAIAIAKRHYPVKDMLVILDKLLGHGEACLKIDALALYTLVSACQIATREPIPFWRKLMGMKPCPNWYTLGFQFYDLIAQTHPDLVAGMDDGWGLE